MNERAAALGMNDTHFMNCCGLDAEEHYTTAYDISLMSRELLKHDVIRQFTTIWMDSVRGGEFGLSNTNKLVRFYSGTTGLKTGFTSKAGYCVSATAERDGMELIAVIMKSDSSPNRNADASGLLNYGFANFAAVGLEGADEATPVRVVLGESDSVNVELDENAGVLIKKSQAAKVQRELRLAESVEAPVERGQKLGTFVFTLDGEELAEVPVLAAEDVPRMGTFRIFGEVLKSLLLRK
jgi:D-alanyl-D-alanine carboxypeptidase (penicillin-binding protein 5/6)